MITTVLSNFVIVPKTTAEVAFTLVPPTTNSNGAFTYTSSNSDVATITNNVVMIVGVGSSSITASQASTASYTSATITATLSVTQPIENNLLVAIGYGANTISTSTDGIIWTGRGSNVITSIGRSVAYANGLWVAVGSGANTIATSTNGTTWTGRGKTVITSEAYGVAYANGLWVAVGEGGNTVATSTDGLTWTGRGSITANKNIAYGKNSSGNGLWIAIGGIGTFNLATSTDGITWTPRNVMGTNAPGVCIAYGNGLWVAGVTGSSKMASSTDGINWTNRGGDGGGGVISGAVFSIAYGNNLWVAFGISEGGTPTYATSTNGMTWTYRGGSILQGIVYSVTYSNNLWIAGGGNSIATSTNGITWTNRGANPITSSILGITAPLISTVLTNFSFPLKNIGDAAFSLTAPTTNSDGTFTYISSNTAVATIIGNVVTIVGMGTSIITACQEITNRFLPATITATITVENVKPVLTNFVIPAKIFGNDVFSITPPTSNSDGAFTYISSNTAVATVTENVVTIIGAGTSTITASQAITADYGSAIITASFVVSRATTVLTNFSAITKTFGDASFSIIAPTTNSDGAFTYTSSNTAVATVAGSRITIVSAGTSTITATQSLTANYTSGTTTATLTVNKATPVLSNFSAITKTFGNAAFSLVAPTSNSTGAFTYTSSNTAVATVSGTTVTIVGGGTATITASQATTTNYLAETIAATMTVSQATPTITKFDIPAKTIGTAPFIIAPPTSNSSGAFTYTSSDTSVATIDGSMVTIVGLGNTTITAVQASTTNYLDATTTGILAIMVNVPLSIAVGSGGNSIATSTDLGLTWTGRGAQFSTSGYDVAGPATYDVSTASVGLYISGPGLRRSADGTNWTNTQFSILNENSTYGNIASGLDGSGNVIFIATGQNNNGLGNTIATTTDGVTWTGRGMAGFNGAYGFASGIAFGKDGSGNNLWVVTGRVTDYTMGEGNCIASSSDGYNWVVRNSTIFNRYGGNDVAFGKDGGGNNLWVAVGGGDATAYATSTNGTSWTGRIISGITIGQSVVFGKDASGGNLWIILSPNGSSTINISKSSDGYNWTTQIIGGFQIPTGIAFGKDGSGVNLWAITCTLTNNASIRTVIYSYDTTTWVNANVVGMSGDGRKISYVNNRWFACTQYQYATSTNGTTWNVVQTDKICYVAYGTFTYTKPTYVAVGQGGNTIVDSANGTTWRSSITTPFTTGGYGVVWNGTQWVAVGSGTNTIAYSADGLIWTGNSTFSSQGNDVAYGKDSSGNGLWVAAGQGGNSLATSTNGITWTGRTGTTVFTTGGWCVAFGKDGSGNNLLVAVGQGGNTIATSTNGTTWTGRGATVFTSQGIGVTYANNRWIAVGSGGNSIATSTNGTTWTGLGTSVFTTRGNDIRYTNNLWVATGEGGANTIATSVNGTTWVGRGSTVFTTAGHDVLGPTTAEPTIIFTIPLKNIGDAPFTMAPTSNSTGLITYTISDTSVATIDGNTVTIVGMGTSTITAVQESTDFFISGTTTATLTVENVKPVVTDFVVPSKTFGDAAFSIVAPTSNSDGAFTYTSSNTAVATVAGSTITIVGGGTSTISAYQAITADYGSAIITATFTVNKATPVLSNFSEITKTFGNAAFSLVAPTSNSTGSFTYTSSNTAVATVSGTTVTIVGGGTATITASQATTANYLAETITATMTVSQATPTITNFSVPAKVLENAPFTIVNPTSNSSGAFTYTSSDTLVATIDGSMVTIVGKGTSTITASQASTTNYLSGSITATFIVRLTPVITNFSVITKTFGDASFSIVAPTTDSDGTITYTSSNTAVATVSGSRITIVSAGTSTITATQSLTANYVSGTITTTLTVNKATPVLSNFSEITKTFGNAAFSIVAPTTNSTGAFTYTSSNTAVATITGTTVTIVGGGTATITASQATTTNYLAGTTTATLTVNKATTVLSNFSAITKTFGNAAFNLVAPTTNSNGAFTYTSSNTAVATVSGTTVTIVGAGTATITASQATTTNYLSGTITTTMTVSQTTPTITIFDVPAKAIGTAPFSLVAPTSNSSGAFTYTSSNTSVATMDGSMVTIVGLGNTTITAVQASTTNYLSGSITGILAIMVNVPLSIAVGQGGNSIATSIDRGLTWTGRTGTTVFSTSGTCVAFGKDGSGNNLLVAVGQGGNTIATSTNGTTWIGRGATVFTSQGLGVTYANNLWVAVGQGTNSIATSTDGVVWTGRTGTSIFSNQGTGVAFNNGLWVAVGQGTNSIATSPDGVVWTGRTGTSIFSNQGIGVAFNNGLWIAVGDGTSNSIATSTNGTVWTGRGKTALSGWGRGVAYGNGLWVAVGQGTNSIATSPDGITWTSRTGTSIFSNQGISVAFNSGVWVALGQGTNTIATSTDGTVWIGRGTSIFSSSGFGVAVGIITPPNVTGISPSAGAIVGGTSVTITGTNFTGATSVTFDGISVTSFNVVNSTTITCITPAHNAGAVGIIVTTEDGPSGEFSPYTYITPPNITGISPLSGSTAGGTNVTITGTSFIGVTSVSFDGLAATTINVVNNTTITCITPARSVGAIGIIVTTLYGTSGAFSPYTYITPPNITSISQLTGSTAGGTNVTITGTNFTGATSVTFDGLAATTINVVNSTTVTCITPAHSVGAVDIIVTTGGGPSGAFSPYTYITPPNITGISPSSGGTAGGTNVTITGTNFTGATSVTFGVSSATTINVVNSTTITCITPARSAGAVGIIVTTGGGPSDAFSPYTYISPPNITGISPSSGSTLGGTSVTITGTSFTGATLVTFGGLSATSLSVVNNTTITCITPTRSTGAVGIVVTTIYGKSVAFSSYTYITPPVISRISPSFGGIVGGTNVTITGRNFTGATLVTFGGLAATSLSIVNSTTITCITPADSAGTVGIIVTTGGGLSNTFSSYTYITPPNITSISQLTGSTAGGTNVTITGTNFTGATSVTFDGIAATSLSILNSTTITCITPARNVGAVGIIVTNGGGPSDAFSSFAYITPPVISSISSSYGSTLGGKNVTITGTNFTGATLVTFGGLAATSLSIVNSTTITCITPARTTAEAVGIIVTTGGGPSGAFSSYTYILPPNITGISPSSGSTAGETNVTITGTNFTGANSVTFDGLAATTINVVNSTTITCITPTHSVGAVGIIVTTEGGSSGAFSSYTYITSSVISSISPSSGGIAGGTSVTITGINFTGATSVTFDGIAATSLSIVNSTTITCITPAVDNAGAVGIIVTNGGGPSDTFSSFTYITPPSITDISPSSGVNTGETSVTITGTNFTGATSVTFGGVVATSLSIVDSTTITCITPAVDSDGDVGIIVTTEGGPSDEFSSFTYITPPSITDISPSSGSTVGETSVTITGINFTGATSVTFDGLSATYLSILNSTTITCITPARTTAGAVGIIVTAEGGPSSEFSPYTYITPPNITEISPSSGSTLGGTNATITGTNFTGATSVTFDDLAATTINVVNSTTITCITPAHDAGDVDIVVTTEGGPSNAFSSYTYITPPSIIYISPSSGSTLGGTSVTITGMSFTEATTVTFNGLAATSLSIVNNTTITCSTPAHNAGDVDIIVTTIYGTSDAFSQFTYITPPNITSISPSSGSTVGETSVTITGTNFTGATSVTFDGLDATNINVVDNTTITCITPAHNAGAVGIIVTTEGGPSSEFSSFTYTTPPNITSISPLTGSTAGGTSVTITGTSFTGETSVTFDGLAATTINVVNSTTITCVTPAHNAGAVGIIVTSEGIPSGEFSSFTYITPPNITGILPSSGSTLGGTNVTITGTNFTGATSVTFDGLAATTINVVNSTTITCITPAHSSGEVGIIVTTGGGPSSEFSSFTYITSPNITGISPLTGSTAGGTSVTITGTSFTGATLVTFGGVAATSLSIVDSTTITCITPARSTAGAVGVIVTTGGGPSNTFASFTYILPPNIKSMTPSSVSRVGGTTVTITGTNFIGATSVTFDGLSATSLNIVNSTSITCITPARNTGGTVGVIVTTGGGPSNTFSTFIYVPFVSAILPTFGTQSGGTAVKITGIAFTGATSVTFGGIPATNVFVFNPTTITCKTPAGIAAVAVGVIVSTGHGPSNTFSSFTYITPPNITGISPSYGGTVGGSIVTITGTSFTGVSSVLFGGLKVKSLRVIDDTTITCVTAARTTPGPVNITVQNSIGISNVFSSFTYIITPKITGISPNFGSTTGGNTVTVTGTDFTGATEVTVGDISCATITVIDNNTLTCITPARIAPGPVGIIVTTGGGSSKKSSPFTYILPPVITSISPPFGGTTGGNVITITGLNFKGATSVTFGGLGATMVKAVNDTTITCKTPVTLTAGPVDVIVRTGGGPSGAFSSFTYITPPVISNILPPAGSILGGNIVTITGTNLTGTTSVLFGKAASTNITVVDDTTLTCRTPLNKAGASGVIVRTGGGPSNTFTSFTYVTPASISSILPLSGSTNGGTFVTIKGKDFTGATSLTIGGVEATSFTVVSDTIITCITPARIGAGGVGIIVTTAGGASKQFSFYNYITPPVITSLSPSSGSTLGGTIVTITGTNFTGASSVTINGKAATPILVVNNTTITCKAPVSLSDGPVDVIVTTGGGPSIAFSSYTYITPAVITSISPSFGTKAGGTSVTITGTNFTGTSDVLFSLKSATNIIVVNNTTITCVTPNSTNPIAVGVTLTTGAGLSNKFSSFTYR